MHGNTITVVYKWTAKPGQLETLTGIYRQVAAQMKQTEPDATAVQIYVSKAENALYVRDEFAHAGALATHLTETAAAHFPSLIEIATPGSFLFFGEVPEALQQATKQMGLAAEFAVNVAGYTR